MRETKDCFVAISFDTALDPVSVAIAEAVSSRHFNFKRVDLDSPGLKWTDNVTGGIRDAAAVVAVLNNKASDSYRINTNVAYELGLTHVLGKPVIIIVDDIRIHTFQRHKSFQPGLNHTITASLEGAIS